MSKKYFIVEDENGNEIGREEVKDKDKKSIKEIAKDFAEKHPKITKGLKIGGIVTAVLGVGAIAYGVGSRSNSDSDDVNYIPESEPTCLPFDDSAESETTDTTSEEEATTTE